MDYERACRRRARRDERIKRKTSRIEKRLKRKAIQMIIQTKPDLQYSSVCDLLYKFSDIFYKYTKIPIYTWWNRGEIYPDKLFIKELRKGCSRYYSDSGVTGIDQVKGKRHSCHNYYYVYNTIDEVTVFTFAIDTSNRRCKGQREYYIRQMATRFFEMTYPFISSWLGSVRMNILKLPDIHYYADRMNSYYGAIYLRPKGIAEIRSKGYDQLMNLYQEWMASFRDRNMYDLMIDLDCFVVLLKYTSSERSATNYTKTDGNKILEELSAKYKKEKKPVYVAYNLYPKYHLSMQLIDALRIMIMSDTIENDFGYYPDYIATNHFLPSDNLNISDDGSIEVPELLENSLATLIVDKTKIRRMKEQKEQKSQEMKQRNRVVTFS